MSMGCNRTVVGGSVIEPYVRKTMILPGNSLATCSQTRLLNLM